MLYSFFLSVQSASFNSTYGNNTIMSTPTTRCSKKAVAYNYFNKNCGDNSLLKSTNFLDFNSDSSCSPAQLSNTYIPMIWSSKRVDSTLSNILKMSTMPEAVITINEPNYVTGNSENIISPQEAAAIFPDIIQKYKKNHGMKIVAPSPIDCSGGPGCAGVSTAFEWLDQFIAACPSCWTDIDYLSIHQYTSFANCKKTIESYYAKYKKPIWVTEVSNGYASPQEQLQFMKELINYVSATDFVHKVFWVSAREIPDKSTVNGALIDNNGQLTELGAYYQNQCF